MANYEILKTKQNSNGTEVVYRLDYSVDSTILGKLGELGSHSVTKFNRFDRIQKPSFRIKNRETGVEVCGKLGENFLYCLIEGKDEDGKNLIESKLQNVG